MHLTIESLIQLIPHTSMSSGKTYPYQLIDPIINQLNLGLALTRRQYESVLPILESLLPYFPSLAKEAIENEVSSLGFRESSTVKTADLVKYEGSEYFKLVYGDDYAAWSWLWRAACNTGSPLNAIPRTPDGEALIETTADKAVILSHNLAKLGFDISDKCQEVFDRIKEIEDSRDSYEPYITIEDGVPLLHTGIKQLSEYFESIKDGSLVEVLYKMSLAGVKIPSYRVGDPVVDVVLNDQFYPKDTNTITTNENIDSVIRAIGKLDAFPLVVAVLESQPNLVNIVDSVVRALPASITKDEICVFFRERRGTSIAWYVKDNDFSRQINENTKVVFISATRLPKPLLSSCLRPKTAVYMCRTISGISQKYAYHVPTVFELNQWDPT